MSNPERCEFSASLLDLAFPFHFVFDNRLTVQQVGSSLTKVCPAFRVGARLDRLVRVDTPKVALNADALSQLPHSLFMLRLIPTGLVLRGQIMTAANANLLFVGSPWGATADELEALGLSLKDFAVHDATIEHLFIQKAQNAQLADLKRMVTQLRAAAEEQSRLAAAEQALAHDLNAASDIRIRFDPQGKVLEARFADGSIGPQSQLIGQNIYAAFPYMRDQVKSALQKIADAVTVAFEFQTTSDGTLHYFEARMTETLDGGFLLLARDITESRKLETQLAYQSSHDPLTELPNRVLFQQRIEQALEEQYRPEGSSFAVLVIDINDFKTINDSYGQAIGDQILVELASRLKEHLRKCDTAARLGGDEFGILLAGVTADQAEHFADRLLTALCVPLEVGGAIITAKVSVGIAMSEGERESNVLFRNADLALYEAKDSSKGRATLFEPQMYVAFIERSTLIADLQSALDQQQVELYYQPIVALDSEVVVGVEALARWAHAERGWVPPSVFIEIAEETGLIIELGKKVLKQACQQSWLLNVADPNRAPLSVSVNLSPRQLQDPSLLSFLTKLFDLSGLDPSMLILEITENALMMDFNHAASVLRKLKQLGVSVALDDFGTGYSSLKYLERLPIDILKIDRSFVKLLERDDKKVQLAEIIINLAKAMDLKIIAEGIETSSQLARLQQLGCGLGQGYYFSPPLPFRELSAFLIGTDPRPIPATVAQTCKIAPALSKNDAGLQAKGLD